MVIRRRRIFRGVLMIGSSILTVYFCYIILLQYPSNDHTQDKEQSVDESGQSLVEMHLPDVSQTKAVENKKKKVVEDILKGTRSGSEEVLDAEGNPIPDPELRKEVKRITDKVPTTFLPEYKNPCWLDAKNELNCLPYFYLIGMSKCGTTDLWTKLTSHPDVVPVPKEPHWWGPRRTGWTGLGAHDREVLKVRQQTKSKDDSSIDWYLNWFKMFAVNKIKENVTTTSQGEKYHPKVFGDGSISTAYSIGNAWMETDGGVADPPYTNADLLHAIQPKAKIIIMLRNPTERARSWYYYTHPLQTPDDWHNNALSSIKCYNGCIQDHNERYCAYSFGCPYTPFQGINVGLYHIFLYDWINMYTREGVLVLRLEDWHADQVSVYRSVLEFLELRPLTPTEEINVLGTRWNHFSNKVSQSETKEALDNFYRPHNKKLAELLQNDIYIYP